MNLENIIYMVIKKDGTIYYIEKNDKYFNHYQYLDDFRKQTEYLTKKAFGLQFSRDSNIPNIVFFTELVDDSCIVFENHNLNQNESLTSVCLYLPDQPSNIQAEILNGQMKEIAKAKFIFLELYNREIKLFESLTTTTDELKNTNALCDYLNNPIKDEGERAL